MEEQLSELLELAKRAARAAADVHRSAIEKGRFKAQTKASSADLVTAIDREAEQALVDVIRAARTHDEIVGEEGANLRGDSGVRWILDPLDICMVASGALDAFYECGLGQWDIAAAAAIAEAAEATVLLLHSALLPNPLLVVANAKLAEAMVAALKEAGAIGGRDL